ncbi:MAG: 50S ribosomal protein L17 [Bdellovibrionales bacterium GWB1_52_6]|nr:MAG: 50S ribosomal protein L17 [Bdellovibrionales bacterium GWB1_52_6]
MAMFRNMANSVIEKEQIVTTVQKAKETRRVVDRLITLGKKGTAAARRLAFDRTRDDDVVKKLFTTLAERYKERNGGYTRVLKVADRRWGDAAEMAVLELVDHPELDRKRKPKAKAEGKDAEGKEVQAAGVKDPFNRFRKIFKDKSKVGPAAGKASKASKSGAARKTPSAGGGGSKAGGSS